jgi:Cdc6-like AAA superfamily ATPase
VELPIYFPKACVSRRKYFQRRDSELNQIAEMLLPSAHEALEPQSVNLLTFAITGLGGSGKTELAHKFVGDYKDK